MKLPSWKWWQWTLAIFAGLVVVSAIGRCADPVAPGKEPRAQVAVAQPAKILNSRQVRDKPFLTYAILVEPGSNGEALATEARKLCGDSTFCQVSGWTDDQLRARGFPFTDREAAGVVFSYNVNRNTGYDRPLWDCRVFTGIGPEQCLAPQGEDAPTS